MDLHIFSRCGSRRAGSSAYVVHSRCSPIADTLDSPCTTVHKKVALRSDPFSCRMEKRDGRCGKGEVLLSIVRCCTGDTKERARRRSSTWVWCQRGCGGMRRSGSAPSPNSEAQDQETSGRLVEENGLSGRVCLRLAALSGTSWPFLPPLVA